MKNRSLALLRIYFAIIINISHWWWQWFLLVFSTLSILLNKYILLKILKFFFLFILLIFFENFALLEIMRLWSKYFTLHITFEIAPNLIWIRCCCYTSGMQLLLFYVLLIHHSFFVFACYLIHIEGNTPFIVFLLKYCFQCFYWIWFLYICWFFILFLLAAPSGSRPRSWRRGR